jgi:curli biogenesis system outer membrane secretion channel CsgG
MRSLLLAVVLAACSSSSPQPAQQPAAPAPANPAQESPLPATPPAEPTAPGVGQKCGTNDLCAQGTECVSYYGIAGARGPQFKTCEIKCGADKQCPSGLACKTIADGPGQVCR